MAVRLRLSRRLTVYLVLGRGRNERLAAVNVEASHAGKKRKGVRPTPEVFEATKTNEEDTDDDMPLITRNKARSKRGHEKAISEQSSSSRVEAPSSKRAKSNTASPSFGRCAQGNPCSRNISNDNSCGGKG
ncbi:hypothetical protein ACFE04_024029 [Oxalis oulophora]